LLLPAPQDALPKASDADTAARTKSAERARGSESIRGLPSTGRARAPAVTLYAQVPGPAYPGTIPRPSLSPVQVGRPDVALHEAYADQADARPLRWNLNVHAMIKQKAVLWLIASVRHRVR
jgi:hypothetical protein